MGYVSVNLAKSIEFQVIHEVIKALIYPIFKNDINLFTYYHLVGKYVGAINVRIVVQK